MVGSGSEGIFAVEFAAVESRSLRGLFVEPIPGTPEGIKKRGEAEAALWGSLIRELKIEAD
jgi:hypothetical protein